MRSDEGFPWQTARSPCPVPAHHTVTLLAGGGRSDPASVYCLVALSTWWNTPEPVVAQLTTDRRLLKVGLQNRERAFEEIQDSLGDGAMHAMSIRTCVADKAY